MTTPSHHQLRVAERGLEQALLKVLQVIRAAGGRPLLVGGCVRDSLLGIPAKDIDLEVYHLQPEKLLAALARHYRVDPVGTSFGVLKLHGLPIDVSVPRREARRVPGEVARHVNPHRDFIVDAAPDLDPREASLRRDFTINAIALDSESGELIDPWSGATDLERRILRHTSEQFVEDPLRVLRGMQFAARFELTAAPQTIALCRKLSIEGLARERVYDEWRKLLLRGVKPSRGLAFLAACGWTRFFPELAALEGCVQDPGWHPEGDVWVHTLHCLDAFAAERTGDEEEDLIVGLAVLCHDLGKPSTTALLEGRIRSYGHDLAGEAPTRSFLARLSNSPDLLEAVVPLVVAHLRPQELYEAQAGDSAIRRLARRVQRIDRLVRVARADRQGRPPLPFDGFPAGDWLLERARSMEIAASAPKPIVLGRHLMELGLTPGKTFKPLLDACYEAQLDGEFLDLEGGKRFVRKRLEQAPPE